MWEDILIIGETLLAIPPRLSCSANCIDVLRVSRDVGEDIPQLEQTITPEDSPDKNAIWLQEMFDLRQRSHDIPHPV